MGLHIQQRDDHRDLFILDDRITFSCDPCVRPLFQAEILYLSINHVMHQVGRYEICFTNFTSTQLYSKLLGKGVRFGHF